MNCSILGRVFYKCGENPAKCKFFLWGDEAANPNNQQQQQQRQQQQQQQQQQQG